jgi:glycerol-3-phosphate O-acyltransferase/dihydroxyacetone phosphate acyltransferase
VRRLVAWVARFAASLLFRRVEVAGLDRLPRARPVLLVANHFNGFVDPVLIATALGRLPRFIAKAGLRRIPVAGLLLRSAGVVFVHRRVDQGGAEASRGNEDAFVECHRALAGRDIVAIFPEGTTHDRAQIDPIKTGAARIALGARTAGASDLAIVPVGLTFPDKVSLRSSALVQLGRPIDLDVVCPDGIGADDPDAVRQLTGVIDRGIRAVSPDFPDVETALALDQAAQIALSSREDPDPSLEARADLARRLGRASPSEQEAVRRDVGRYLTTLAGLHLSDADVVRPTNPAGLLRSAFWIAVLVVLLGGLVAATALVNVWPAILVVLVSLVVKTPVSKGTARVLVGLVAFPVAWITAAVLAADELLHGLLVFLTAAAGALAAVWMVERALALGWMLLRWQAQRERVGTVGLAEAVRDDVVDTVRSVAGPP